MRRAQARLLAAGVGAAVIAAAPAAAGPPYVTDDPEPTDLGQYEIYLFGAADGQGGSIDGALGLDLNYGAVKNIQLTATLPIGVAREDGRWRTGRGDVELGIKFRFFQNENAGLSAAAFPRVILPTASSGFGNGRTRLLLPLWAQKDWGDWSLFGGGGYEINPGSGNRDFWQAGMAATRQINPRLSVGGEVTHQGPDAVGGSSVTTIGIGSIVGFGPVVSLLLSGGPSMSGGKTGYRSYAALGFNF